jgi:SAM-dependent MidA family methyltransferase
MSGAAPLRQVIHNLLESGDLTFRDFMEIALYHPEYGYYSRAENPVGKAADYVTSPQLSPLFSWAVGRLVSDFASRGGDEVSTVVDIGCGDGALIHSLYEMNRGRSRPLRFYGVDRSLSRVGEGEGVRYVRSLGEVPRDGQHLLLANELFDAFPFHRLVQRGEHLHELWVTEREGALDWSEHEAPAPFEDYFAERSIELSDGQFADLSLEWASTYEEMCRFLRRGVIVVFDYGYPEKRLFDPRVRRFGTAASYRQHRVSRDLLVDPGLQDLTAHINFTDLVRSGEREGLRTVFFDRQAKFLLALGGAEHELLRPVEELEIASLEDGLDLRQRREDAKRLLLPDGIGEDIRVLVQTKDLDDTGWTFQRPLFDLR